MQKIPRHHLSKRIQEFELWKDETGVTKNIEYAQRRSNRNLKFKKLNSDRRLKCWRRLYYPSMCGILLATVILMCSSVYSVGHNTFFWSHKNTFHIVGSVCLGIGVVGLLAAAGLTYSREQTLRVQLGLPNMFSQEWKTPDKCSSPCLSTKDKKAKKEEARRNSNSKKKTIFERETSLDSAEMSTFLESSTSSPLTDVTWLEMSASSAVRFQENSIQGKVPDVSNNVLFTIHSKEYCASENSSGYCTGISEHDRGILESGRCLETYPMLLDTQIPISSGESQTTVRMAK